jgi:TolB protein
MARRGQRSAVRRPAGLLAPLLALAGSAVFAVATGAVEVFIDATRGAIQKIPIAVYGFKSVVTVPGQSPVEVLKADLRRSLLFDIADLERFGIRAEVNSQPGPEALQKAGDAGLEVQVWGTLLRRGSEIVMEGTLYESSRGEVGRKRYVGSAEAVRHMVHRLADEIVFHYTGEQGIARTQIAYVSERDGAKELFVMDYDGYNRRRLTFDASLNLAPAWSPDRRRLAFVTFRKRGDPRIEDVDVLTGARRTLVAFPGLNITPAWSSNGEELAFATSKDGNSEIYKVDKDGKRFERLTDHWAADFAPTWSPTGRELAFTSDRGGTPQIYLMSEDGTNVRPLTYRDQQGSYNTSAAWSPKGDWIVYVCRDERRILKICLISPDGQQGRQLTSGSSNDESPSWSADGRHVAFSSTRNERRDIYMINVDGTGLDRLTTGGTSNEDPAWSGP